MAMDLMAARQAPVTGRIVNRSGEAVDYATVVLLRDNLQAAGTTTDSEGCFTLSVAAGDYTLQVSHLSYETCTQQVSVTGGDLGEIILEEAANRIDDVVVKAQLIRREADRFVVDVANAPSAIGKDGIELLERAPGVWVDEENISINGKSGSKIYINEHELKLTGEQLVTYIRNLRTEDIQKIEVIPVSGADYDADSASGIIKITLRRRRENGLQGSLSMRTSQSKWIETYNPAGNINLHSGRVDLQLSAWGTFGSDKTHSDERTSYDNGTLESHSTMIEKSRDFGGSFSSVIELSPRHEIGFGANYWQNSDPMGNDTRSELSTDMLLSTVSRYERRDFSDNLSATANYLWKIDTLGSTFKVIGDYTRRNADIDDNNRSAINDRDSLHRDYIRTDYTMGTINAAFEKHFSPRWGLSLGAKYTYYRMKSAALYEYNTAGSWLTNENESFDIDYTEQIGAVYGIVSGRFDRWSFRGGLRGEYTKTDSDGSRIARDYFSLFPNANISCNLDSGGKHQLIFQYARKISRPSFWQLNPQRTLISDYCIQQGNPMLDPSYDHDVSLTLVLAQRYALTAGVEIMTDDIQQAIEPSAEDPNLLEVNWINYKDMKQYYANLSLPLNLTKWWEASANLTYVYMGYRAYIEEPINYFHFIQTSVSSTFTLPKKFYIDLSWNYRNRFHLGNSAIFSEHYVSASLKKKFGERFTATFSARNLLNQKQRIETSDETFTRRIDLRSAWQGRMYTFKLTYNFKAGKAFRTRSVEGDSEGQSRL